MRAIDSQGRLLGTREFSHFYSLASASVTELQVGDQQAFQRDFCDDLNGEVHEVSHPALLCFVTNEQRFQDRALKHRNKPFSLYNFNENRLLLQLRRSS